MRTRMRILVVALTGGLIYTAQAADWYDLAWKYRQAITIESDCVNEDLTNFPVLITEANVQTGVFARAQSDGKDILFTKADKTTKLGHEIDEYDATGQQMDIWVKIPVLSDATDTVIYMYYGNPTASSQQDATNVWSEGYRAVWHLKEDAAGTGTNDLYQDSTAYTNHGDDYVTATGKLGQIGRGQQFTGPGSSDAIYVGDVASLNFGAATDFTISFWVKTTNTQAGIVNKGMDAGGVPGYNLNIGASKLGGGVRDTNSVEENFWSDTLLDDNQWHHNVVTFDRDGYVRVYTDAQRATWGPKNISTVGNIDTTDAFEIGYYWVRLKGYLDELSVSAVLPSTNWIAACYTNQASPTTFSSSSGEEQLPPAGTSIMIR